MSVYYNFEQTNSSSSSVLIDKQDALARQILDKADDYKLSVLKFNLPASTLESFRITDSTSYKIDYSWLRNVALGNAGTPYTRDSASRSLVNRTTFPMYTIEDFIENFNRTSMLCYKDLLEKINTQNYVNKITGTASGSVVGTGNQYVDIPLVLSNTLTNNRLGYVALDLAIGGTSIDTMMELQLIDPHANKCIVSSSKQYSKTNFVNYHDGCFNSQHTADDTVLQNGSEYHPLESFTKFTTEAANQLSGNWTLRVINKQPTETMPFDITYDATLSLWTIPQVVSSNPVTTTGYSSKFPRFAPILSLDSTNKLQLTIDEDTPRTGFKIRFTHKLASVLGFPSVYDSATGLSTLKLIQYPVVDGGNINLVNILQPVSTAYRLLDISEIQLRTNSIPVDGEADSVSSTRIITSINTSSSDLQSNVYEFVNSQPDQRSYQLTNSQPLKNIHLAVWIKYRSSSEVVQAHLPAHSNFTCLLKFEPQR